MAKFSEVIGDMYAREDRDSELISTVMKVKDLLMVSASIVDEVFNGDNKFQAMDRNRMVLTIYDLIKEEDETKAELETMLKSGDDIIIIEDGEDF